MTTVFSLKNKELNGDLLLTVNGQSNTLSAEATKIEIELGESDAIELTAEYQHKDNDGNSVKNPILKFLFSIAGVAVYLILALLTLYDGEKLQPDSFFKGTNPFIIRKTFRLKPTEKRNIKIKIEDADYSKISREITEPDIWLEDAEIISENTEIWFRRSFAEKQYKRDFIMTYAIVYILVIALNVLGVILICNSFASADKSVFIGVCAVETVFLAMFAIPICLCVRTHKLYKLVFSKLEEKYKTRISE